MNQPTKQDIWRGEHLGFAYKIVHWGVGQYINDGKGVWNYYVCLSESRIPDFESIWLQSTVIKITPESRGFVYHDYYSIPPASVDWHGGVTYYDKHGDVPGYRVVELGCDYSHLWDMENGYSTTLEDVLHAVENTITQLNELYPLAR